MNTSPATSALPACCAVVELRQYTLVRDRRDALIALFEREFIESQEALGICLIGTFRDLDNPDRFVWLRGFADMSSRCEALAAFYGGPIWQAHREQANATMIDSDNVLLLRPAFVDSGFAANDRKPPFRDASAPSAELVMARIHPVSGSESDVVLAELDARMARAMEVAGGRLLMTFESETAVNDFPRLPVRDAERVRIWIVAIADRAMHQRCRDAIDASAHASDADGSEANRARRSDEFLLLEPTARSRLPQ